MSRSTASLLWNLPVVVCTVVLGSCTGSPPPDRPLPRHAAVRVDFVLNRDIVIKRGTQDTLWLPSVSTVFGRVRAQWADTLLLAVSTVDTGAVRRSLGLPRESMAAIRVDDDASVTVLSRHPGALELGIFAGAAGAVLLLILNGVALGGAGS